MLKHSLNVAFIFVCFFSGAISASVTKSEKVMRAPNLAHDRAVMSLDGTNAVMKRVSLSYLNNYYELPVLWAALDVYHDPESQRYYVAFLDNEETTSLVFQDTSSSSKYFKSAPSRGRDRQYKN